MASYNDGEYSHPIYGRCKKSDIAQWLRENPYVKIDDLDVSVIDIRTIVADDSMIELLKSDEDMMHPIPKGCRKNLSGLFVRTVEKETENSNANHMRRAFAVVLLLKSDSQISALLQKELSGFSLGMGIVSDLVSDPDNPDHIARAVYIGCNFDSKLVLSYLSSFKAMYPLEMTQTEEIANILKMLMWGHARRAAEANGAEIPPSPNVFVRGSLKDTISNPKVKHVLEALFLSMAWTPCDRWIRESSVAGFERGDETHYEGCIIKTSPLSVMYTGFQDERCTCDMERVVYTEVYRPYFEELKLFDLLYMRIAPQKIFPWPMHC